MIGERVVLRGVQHLQQRTGRIALIRHPQLVYLVQQEDRILSPSLLHPLDDAPWHRPHVGTPVTTNVRLVARATQGDADVLTS